MNGKDKSTLSNPLERGAYAIATRDRKTVLKMLVMSRDEARFDPDAYAKSQYALGASSELLGRLRGTWTVCQLSFESHDPMVYPALDFLLDIAIRLGELTEGVIADPVSHRYLLPHQVRQVPRVQPLIDAREFISISLKSRQDGIHAFTLGLQKFDLPELEIVGIAEGDETSASRFLLTLAQSELMGEIIRSGDRFGAPKARFEAREGGFDADLWKGLDVLELLPPTTLTSSEALAAWNAELKTLEV